MISPAIVHQFLDLHNAPVQGVKYIVPIIKGLALPAKGNHIVFDSEIKGFGVRVTQAGAKSFILNYRADGVQRRITIGSCSDWTASRARVKAKEMKCLVALGDDPMGALYAARAAPTMDDLADRFELEHLSKRRESTSRDYKSLLKLYVRPHLGNKKVARILREDVERLHAVIAKKAPYSANRTVAVLSKMFTLSINWNMRADNPARGIERAPEEKREKFLTLPEIERLAAALVEFKERATANAIRLLLLTGARRGEVLGARWDQLDLAAGVWTKPSAHTKQKKVHRVPISAPALALLKEIKADAEKRLAEENKTRKAGTKAKVLEFVFPGVEGKHLQEPKRGWLAICKQAGLAVQVPKLGDKGKAVLDKDGNEVMVWQATLRIHDLRHTYASVLASANLSLPIIGRLLGHTQAATTQRYAHLFDDPLRAATEHVGALVTTAVKRP